MSADPAMSNDELLQRAKNGDIAALGSLLARYRNYLSVLARLQIHRHLQRKVDASDIVQEAHLGAIRDFAKFRGESEREFAGWLRQILAHTLANTIRHYQGTQQRDIRLERQLASDVEHSSMALAQMVPASASSPSRNASRREWGAVLADALALLPDDLRQVITLRHFEGLTFPQVAERMGRTVDSVKKLWPRALARLRMQIKGIWNDDEAIP